MSWFLIQKVKRIFWNLNNYYQLKFRKFYRIFFCLSNILIFSTLALNLLYKKKNSYFEKLKIFKFLIVLLFTISFLIKSFFADAGDIPIKRKEISSMDEKEFSNIIGFKEIKLNNYTIQMKFCRTCMIWRPPRTSHCSLCGSCKLKFDHHCPWIGKCIALKNYRHFLFFILYLFWLLISNWNFILSNDLSTKKILIFRNKTLLEKKLDHFLNLPTLNAKLSNEIVLEIFFLFRTFLKIASFFASLFTGALLIFHIYLGYTGKTTSEFLKFPDKSIKSWSLRKELLNKFYKKKIFTLKEIRFTEKKDFFLVNADLITGLKVESNHKKIKKSLRTSLKQILISLNICFLILYTYTSVRYRNNRIIQKFFHFLYCLIIIIISSTKLSFSLCLETIWQDVDWIYTNLIRQFEVYYLIN